VHVKNEDIYKRLLEDLDCLMCGFLEEQ
jgi:hypothetical protein